ncbi:hypothetical protein ABEG17_05980 [Pedococcus sp. KACC 23699]|uniref:Uncharacterized protein n=1 Tax=Pedococcus sp. KACC 23699 TaxID=3149228 RepID=A0AAU7JWT2_9MICO
MVVTAHRAVTRPLAEWAVVLLLGFLGLTAVAGGFVMTTGLGGSQVRPPADWLDEIPLVSSWVVPGLVLMLGFGVGSLVTARGMLRRSRWAWLGWAQRLTGEHWSWLAAMVLGAGQVLWIVLELVYLPAVSWFHPLYGAVGLALALLPLRASVRADLAVGSAPRGSAARSTVAL